MWLYRHTQQVKLRTKAVYLCAKEPPVKLYLKLGRGKDGIHRLH